MKRVVIRAPDWLGDAVMALPAIRSVRQHFTDATLIVAGKTGVAPIYRGVRELDEVVLFGGGAREEAQALTATGADLGILLKNSFGSAWRMYRARLPERWGYRTDARGLLLTRGIPRPRGRAARNRHQSAYYLDLIAALGIAPGPPDIHIDVSDQSHRAARALLDLARIDDAAPIVAFAPGAAYGGAKRWPPEYVARLIDQVTYASDASCVLVGSAADRRTGLAIEAALGGLSARRGLQRFANLIAQTDLPTLMGVLSLSRAVVSNDSGAMHLASAVGRPVVAIFGPTNDKATAPIGPHRLLLEPVKCRPCMLPECPIDHRCMRRVTPDRVLAALLEVMA